ncbi:DUF368 domain-containing protein [Aquibacillus sp. 3ASR75-11]|uniref:DUF368 domain-containing protein n=1 Tax=Terrihalobacillus insolitus TaxID=2950438 RepID=A0A9X3WUR2_9BACI|nr:DUF368 domain-containing protein [Terrihalobacillus insolitus]MDC3413140.1 DUF368 domain-containing protein [Terrihalobacillus insolitus]MDC3425188.1 DUF368 domain-containing protein [Terrihalobacillus insolitus]
MEWKNIYRGMLMGASDVIPGVSGGTIAVVLGIYDRLIEAINGFFSKEWKRHLGFLIPLGVGVVTAILVLADLIEWLFENHPDPTQFAFLGLIIGVLPYLFHTAEAKKKFKMQHILLFVVGAALVASLAFFQTGESEPMLTMTLGTYIFLFFSGFIASSAMILPGISGSFILLIIGVYSTIINAISELKLDIIAVVGVGIIVGIIVMSKVIHFFMERFTTGTYAVVIGLVVGSVVVIFPGWPTDVSGMLTSIATFALGLVVAVVLGRVEYN